MSTILILGAGIAGHTAASYLQKGLNKSHQIFAFRGKVKMDDYSY
jgi:thioredoxin reductase